MHADDAQPLPMVTMPDGSKASWITESSAPPPATLAPVDDRLAARVALARLRAGETLLWTGDYRNGCQLLDALRRRLTKGRRAARGSAAKRWRAERRFRAEEARILGGVVVSLETDGSLDLRRAPDTRAAVELAWGPASCPRLVAMRTLRGALGAAGWTQKGLQIDGLPGPLHPRYGVWSPTRSAYLSLLDALPTPQTLVDVGCGTGVLALRFLARGTERAVATDLDPRAVACTRDNAHRMGLAHRLDVREGALFAGADPAELVIFNAPWMPETPSSRLDRAVFDPGGTTTQAFLEGLPAQLATGGRGALILSDLPERIGLRDPDWVSTRLAEAGLTLAEQHDVAATHRRAAKADDPLHSARSAERIRLFICQAS